MTSSQATLADVHVCHVRLGSHVYALEGEFVKQVVALSAVTSLPRTPEALRGLFAFQGNPTALFDLGTLLSQAPATGDLALIVESRAGRFAFQVDAVLGFSALEEAPKRAPGQHAFVQGISSFAGGHSSLLNLVQLTRSASDMVRVLT